MMVGKSAVLAAFFIFVGLAGTQPDVQAQSLPLTTEGHSPFVDVVRHVKDAVVNISAELSRQDQEQTNPFGSLFDELFPWQESPSQNSLGSGFLISADGYILTNNHVVADADEITVRLSDKSEFTAELVGVDAATDLALLRIRPGHAVTFLEFGDSDSLLVGDWVIAIGNPFPQQGLDRTVTVGVISALGRTDLNFVDGTPTYQNYIQTDASINPGNSGGPLVSLSGKVVGINSAIASPTGSNVGIGFAIPINFAKVVIPDLQSSGKVNRGWLGIQPRDITWDDVEAEGLPSADGVLIDRVFEDTPAREAGLQPGDVIVGFDDVKILDAQHFMRLIWMAKPDAEVKLSVFRRGTPMDVFVRLTDRDKGLLAVTNTVDSTTVEPAERWLGLEVQTCTPQIAERLHTTYQPGVLVVDIDPEGPAYEKGIRPGMIIGEIDHRVIEDIDDYNMVVGSMTDRKKAVSLLVYDRRGNTGYIAVRPE